jgi:hypothetical protein
MSRDCVTKDLINRNDPPSFHSSKTGMSSSFRLRPGRAFFDSAYPEFFEGLKITDGDWIASPPVANRNDKA